MIISGCVHITWTVMELAGKRFLRKTDKNESEWLGSVARGSHGIQPHSEEKKIVCQVWSPDTVEGRSPDTILLLQPNGMVEIVGSIPSCIS